MGFLPKSRLSIVKQAHLMAHFVAGTTARTASALCGVDRKTAACFYPRLREVVAYELEAESKAIFASEVEVDESYFGGRRKGQRGRGAAGKAPVFCLLKRAGRVYTKVILDASGATLAPLVERKVAPDSIVYTDSWKGYNALGVSSLRACGLTTQSYSRTSRAPSMVLRTFGVRPSVTCASSTVCRGPISSSF